MTTTWALLWKVGRVVVDSVTESGGQRIFEQSMPMRARRVPSLALTAVPDGLVVRSRFAERSPFAFISWDGTTMMEPVPGEGPLMLARCRAHPSGSLTVIDGTRQVRATEARPNQLSVSGETGTWSTLTLPRGFVALDCVLAGESFKVAGARLSDPGDLSGRTEAAVYEVALDGSKRSDIAYSWRERNRLRLTGGLDSFTNIDSADPLIVRSSGDWPLLSETVVVVRELPPATRVSVFRREQAVGIVRSDGEMVFVTSTGKVRRWGADGWETAEISQALESRIKLHSRVSAVAGFPDDLVVAVTAFDPDADPTDRRAAPSGCRVMRLKGGEVEILTEIEGYGVAGLAVSAPNSDV